MGVIGVVATLKVQAGKEADFEATFKDLRDKVQSNEDGNLQYDLTRSKADAQTYVIMEKYASQEALEAHGQTEYFKAAGPALGTVLAGAPDIQYLDILD